MARPRKNEPAGVAARQAKHRVRQGQRGMIRREFLLSPQAVEDEIYIKDRWGIERVRQLIGWAMRRQREAAENADPTPDIEEPTDGFSAREFFVTEVAAADVTFVREKWGPTRVRRLIARTFATARKEMEDHGKSDVTGKGTQSAR